MAPAKQPPPPDARDLIDRILDDAVRRRASDVHVEPVASGYEVRTRIDGLLRATTTLDASSGRAVVNRLMVLAQLLTYRLDVPQEGRLQAKPASAPGPIDLRLAIMPTIHGLRAAIRLPAELIQPRSLDELLLPEPVVAGLKDFAAADGGMLLLTGPAGSGKTTTIYALLRHIAESSPGLSIIALEDPVERALPGVTQVQVQPFGELTYERALRSVLRQDPQVLMLGEVRDAATASIAVQAALTGHRLISTLHAGTPGGAIARLVEMGVEPYQITSTLFAVVAQRLLRRRSPGADSTPGAAPAYHGRVPVAEIARIDAGLRGLILARADAEKIQGELHRQPRYATMHASAAEAVARGLTDAEEVRRVLGGEEGRR